MEHKLVPARWKSSPELVEVIRSNERQGWSVVSLGELFGGEMMVLCRDGARYEHQVIQVFWRLRDSFSDIIRDMQHEGWQVAALGQALGGTLLVLKRRLDRAGSDAFTPTRTASRDRKGPSRAVI